MHASSFELNSPEPDGCFDRAEVDPAGVIRIVGWFTGPVSRVPEIALDGEKLSFLQHYRVGRPDVENAITDLTMRQPGVIFEYLVPPAAAGYTFHTLSIKFPNGSQAHFQGDFAFLYPHYRELLTTDCIYHRDNIYCSGPPNTTVHPELMALAKTLPGPILDFGCGSGALVAALKELGVEARGLELNRKEIRNCLNPLVRSQISLYDGTFPLKMSASAFRSVFCSEVLEHIENPRAAVKEISRLASEQAIFTVPDASAIPIGYRHTLAPWHVLEGTHVNFFNQKSLYKLLKPFFSKIEFGRTGGCPINDSHIFTSLVAFCNK